jgi:hypothetical protein
MRPVFVTRSNKNKLTVTKQQTLGEFLNENGLGGQLEKVALYNWGTKEAKEINRALIELVGCKEVKDDPLQSLLDPALGTNPSLYKPEVWKPDGALPLEKPVSVKVRKRLPVPAVSFTKLTRWFIPKQESCQLEYVLEGLSERADKVDFEVHATGYYALSPEGAESPSDTQVEAGSTHLVRKRKCYEVPGRRPPSDAQKAPAWKGESEATKGVLEKKGGDVYIHYGCAPYNVLLRYYKDDQDNKAKLLLKPFFPRWKPVKGGAPVVDDASLVVEWELQDDHGKLKQGQLIIWDKDDKVVFFAPLDENTLRSARRYDLVNGRKKWDKGGISRDAMPYRVQLQAHSDESEEKGLALAVMPTEVRAYQYDRVQFVAFNVKPGTKAGLGGTEYLGAPDHDTDIQKRCDVMKEAIQLAHGGASADEKVLKLFMAPEFYFRGQKGGYPVEKISQITTLMRQETDQFKYADWLFVFGTAIGYLLHEAVDNSGQGTGNALTHGGVTKFNVAITHVDDTDPLVTKLQVDASSAPAVGQQVLQLPATTDEVQSVTSQGGTQYLLTLKAKSAFIAGAAVLTQPFVSIAEVDDTGVTTRLRVRSSVAARIHSGNVAPSARWKIRAAGKEDEITSSTPQGPGEYWLTLANKKGFAAGAGELIEPKATEVFNVALLQKGWPVPHLGDGLKQAAVYKEKVSWIDFIGPNFGKPAFGAVDGSGRLIEIHDEKNRTVLPTEGSVEMLGAKPNVQGPGGGSEINKSGLGGGSVLTVDGITFGLEVCLDHGQSRLHNYYNGKASPGEPTVQIQLIPSWGMSIGGGALCCPNPNGLVFNVDGSKCHSVARVNDGQHSCDAHPHHVSGGPGWCPEEFESRVCPTCNKDKHAPGNCLMHGATVTWHRCAHPKHVSFAFCSVCSAPMPCGTHPMAPPVYRVAHECSNCTKVYWAAPTCFFCGASRPNPCGQYYQSPGTCPVHTLGPPARWRCLSPYQPIGTPLAVVSGPTEVPSSKDAVYFEEGGRVEIYELKSVPVPNLV